MGKRSPTGHPSAEKYARGELPEMKSNQVGFTQWLFSLSVVLVRELRQQWEKTVR